MRGLRRGEVGGMREGRSGALRLLLLGAGFRLVGAIVVAAALWGGFFWATAPLGGG